LSFSNLLLHFNSKFETPKRNLIMHLHPPNYIPGAGIIKLFTAVFYIVLLQRFYNISET
jgi:hypothetical protein